MTSQKKVHNVFWLTHLILLFLLLSSCSRQMISNASYFKTINKAELAIIKGNIKKSNQHYKKAFKNNEKGYAEDYYNGLKSALIVGDIDFAYYNANCLAEKGICRDFFEQFDPLKKDEVKWQQLMQTVDSSGINLNLEYRRVLEEMFSIDQTVRFDRKNREEIRRIDSLNYEKFKELISLYGFPTEEAIGIGCSENRKGIQFMPYSLPLRHFSQRRYAGLDSILINALNQNQIQPYYFFDSMGALGNKDWKVYIDPVVKMNEVYYTYNLDKKEVRDMDEKRRKMGYIPIEEQIKKIMFRLNDNKEGFSLTAPIEIFPNMPELLERGILIPIEIENFNK